MELFFSPLACSLASRIVVYEAKAEDKVAFRQVDPLSKTLVPDGEDYRAINPIGLVPALKTDTGRLLTENVAVLVYLTEQFPEAELGASGDERFDLLHWLSYTSTELHKLVFSPLLNPLANPGAKEYARKLGGSRLKGLDKQLAGREFLLSYYSVADIYLAVVLNWAKAVDIDLTPYPNVKALFKRNTERPAFSIARAQETAMYVS